MFIEGKFPRVLIINRKSIYQHNATGITMRSLWSDWPRDCVLELYTDVWEHHVEPESDAIKSILLPANKLEEMARSAKGAKINQQIKSTAPPKTSRRSAKESIRQLSVCLIDQLGIKVPSYVWETLKEFQPEVIYTLGSSVSTLRLAHEIAHRMKIPMVVHFMDNWVEHLQWEGNPLLVPYKRALDRWLRKCLAHSREAITISESMAKRYEQVLNIKCAVLMNAVDVEKARCKEKVKEDTQKYVYAGGLHLNRGDALKFLATKLKETGLAELHIYTKNAQNFEDEFKGLPVKLFEAVSHDEIKQVYESADVLVHAEAAVPLLLGFFRYSISTKIPEYLASGRPVLFFGPKEMGLYSYLEENGAALCASDAAELSKAIKLLHDSSFVRSMCEKAHALAMKNHHRSRAGDVLYKVLSDSISG